MVDIAELDRPVQRAIMGMDRGALGAAFAGSNFVYGTAGSKVLLGAIQAMARTSPRMHNIYEPGVRANEYVHNHSQMMDLYYGLYNNNTFENRNPLIGEYVHRAMGFTGQYNPSVPGYESYWATFGRYPVPPEENRNQWNPPGSPYFEGWEPPPPEANGKYAGWHYPDWDSMSANDSPAGMSATKYMSRVIRQGIMFFGGSLTFEGAEVYYEAVFSTRPGVRDSDTAMEARALLPYFAAAPGQPEVPFGNGRLKFHWFGQPAVPAQDLFAENWVWHSSGTHRPENSLAHFGLANETCTSLWAQLPPHHPTNPTRQGRLDNATAYLAAQTALHPRNPWCEEYAARLLQKAYRHKARSRST